MSYSIIWSPKAYLTFQDRIYYLERNWTQREINNFTIRVKEYLELLKKEPLIGTPTGRRKTVRIGLIIKEVSIIYRVKPIKKEIELLVFFDNRQDPKKIRKYKT
jgi:plasmid stabilization system protein ParE